MEKWPPCTFHLYSIDVPSSPSLSFSHLNPATKALTSAVLNKELVASTRVPCVARFPGIAHLVGMKQEHDIPVYDGDILAFRA